MDGGVKELFKCKLQICKICGTDATLTTALGITIRNQPPLPLWSIFKVNLSENCYRNLTVRTNFKSVKASPNTL